MIEVTDKSKCCGCSACAGACPVQCISMTADSEGFKYPVADPNICISCGKCEQVCPMTISRPGYEKKAYAARVPQYEPSSSSGGVFSALAENILSDSGVVFGSAFDDELKLRHVKINDNAMLGKLRGSKYVQSDMTGVYQQVQDELTEGRKVLFSGTPCQVAGLKSFLGKEYPELFTVDLACHGVPSPKLWERYVTEKNDLVHVNFRDKSEGWRKYNIAYIYKDRVEKIRFDKDPYMLLFLQNISLRPSCYDCSFRNGGNCSDLTLADFWAIKDVMPEMNDDKGVSAVIVNTSKGESLIKEICYPEEVKYEDAVKSNGGFFTTFEIPAARDEFFKGLDAAENLNRYIRRFIKTKSACREAYERLHTLLATIKRRILS